MTVASVARMTDRERFVAHMHYQPVDRCPLWDFGALDWTRAKWEEQGLPPGANLEALFGLDRQWVSCDAHIGIYPPFERTVVEDRGDRELVRDEDGVLLLRFKNSMSIPHYAQFPIQDRSDWETFKRRLDPNTPGRIPDDWEARCQAHIGRDYPLLISAGSLYGWPRNWMGVETLSTQLFRDRLLFPEMTETLAQLTITVLSEALERARRVGLTFDAATMWEDMCFRDGPLMSPKMVREYMAPHYRAITKLLADYGVDTVILDSDGCIDRLIDVWLDSGVNCHFPIEVGTWQADPVKLRQRFGRRLLMMGGFDKRILTQGPAAIDAEIDRLAPLAAEGGFIPFCDHRVPPDVPLSDYLHYLDRAKQVWGRGVNVRPTWRPVS